MSFALLLGGLLFTVVLGSILTAQDAQAASTQKGRASWYALTSITASGERMNPNALTAAHRSLPFGTKVKVTNRSNGKSVTVRINDRGPFIKGRIIDLSKAAAKEIGIISAGVGSVELAILE
ncbi:septal ring lytic transglycosylase RlpA family protein [Flexibacterium corallicola]|uniref:septal ring lytic transglycosylase RlpA family protein n=1 Tax=Flexibacterium corallicola TaxID=3037259 RepID=UPI00286ECB75|nr:septal ring lytic transglycosylase RlpA family protein [Pseudovibrio sp. M1P-2-3]